MRILDLADSHIKGKNSRNRIGNYYNDCLIKLDEIITLSKKCDMVIHSGDLFDIPNVALTIIDDVVDRIEKANIPWYILPGNHDMNGASWETSNSTALAHIFRRSNQIKLLTELDLPGCYIKGYPYYFEIEKNIKENGLICDNTEKFKIAVTHAFISIKPFHPDVLHVQAKDIKSNFDICLCSHFHSHFDGQINKTRFFNPGEIGRLSITEAKHTPKVGIIDTTTRDIEIIELKCAKKGTEVFDLEKIEEDKVFNKNLDEFISSIQNVKVQGLETKTVVSIACKELNVDKKVKDLLISTIEEEEK